MSCIGTLNQTVVTFKAEIDADNKLSQLQEELSKAKTANQTLSSENESLKRQNGNLRINRRFWEAEKVTMSEAHQRENVKYMYANAELTEKLQFSRDFNKSMVDKFNKSSNKKNKTIEMLTRKIQELEHPFWRSIISFPKTCYNFFVNYFSKKS